MRRITTFIMLLIIFVSCKNKMQEIPKDAFVIDGKLMNAKGKQVLLQRLTIKDLVSIDSVVLKEDGSFKFTVKADETSIYLLKKDANSYITLIADKGENIKFESDYEKFNKLYKVEGSQGSQLIAKLNQHIQKNLVVLDSLGKIWEIVKNDNNRVQIKADIDSTYFRTVREQRDFQLNFINQNAATFAAMLALYIGLDRTQILSFEKDMAVYEKVSKDLLAKYPSNSQAIELDKRIKQMKMLIVEKKLTDERNSK